MKQERKKRAGQTASTPRRERSEQRTCLQRLCVCECVCGLCERQWQEMEGGGEKNAEEEEEESSGAHRERVGDLYKILS